MISRLQSYMGDSGAKGMLVGVLLVGMLISLPFLMTSTEEEKQRLTQTTTTMQAVEQSTGLLDLKPVEEEHLREMLKPVEEAPETDFDRMVWVQDMQQIIARWVSDRHEAENIARWVYIHSVRFELSPELVLSVIAIESRFDHFAISSVGARGLMQVMPFWKKRLGSSSDNLFDVETNIRYGCAIIRHYLDRYKQLDKALAAYNGSLGRTKYPVKVFTQMRAFKATREDSRSS